MKVTIYHNPRCSKSRQSLSLVQEKADEVEVVEYLKDPPDADRLRKLLSMLGLKARELLRTTEAAYKEAGLADSSLGDDEIIAAMVKHPILIQRPIVVAGRKAVIGRPPERVIDLLDDA